MSAAPSSLPFARAERAPVVVALHCSAGAPAQWAPCAALLPAAWTVEAPALIGYGPGPASCAETPHSLNLEVAHLARGLMRHDARVHLVGHSFGGAVALQIALRWPQRILSLTLYEPVRFALLREAGSPAWREIDAVAGDVGSRLRAGRRDAAGRRFVDYWSGAGAWDAMPPRRREAVAACMPKVAREFEALFQDRLPLSDYRRLRMPVTLARGSASPRPTRRIADLLGEACPTARVVELEGAGHLGPLTEPARFAALIAAQVDAAPALAAAA